MENWSQSDIMEHMFSPHLPSGALKCEHNFVRIIDSHIFDRLLIASVGVHDAILNTNLWEFESRYSVHMFLSVVRVIKLCNSGKLRFVEFYIRNAFELFLGTWE